MSSNLIVPFAIASAIDFIAAKAMPNEDNPHRNYLLGMVAGGAIAYMWFELGVVEVVIVVLAAFGLNMAMAIKDLFVDMGGSASA
jgi:hypothetical protein